MKRPSNHSSSYHTGPNMTPLVDVVMVILIFLMLAGSFNSSEHYLSSKSHLGGVGQPLPTSTPAPDPNPVTKLDVYVSPAADGGFTALVGGAEETADLATLSRTLGTLSNQYAGAGMPPDSVQVILHPGTRSRWESVAGVYDVTLRAGFKKVAFAEAR